jgi:protein-L-isoaspartate(D-aspartate) O-methyltransferase
VGVDVERRASWRLLARAALPGGALAAAVVLMAGSGEVAGAKPGDDFGIRRQAMVARQVRARGLNDSRVLGALEAVPRHLFVPASERAEAYGDHPLPIGHGQTISQPYIVALMTELLHVKPGARVLEIGTGSGYQAAVLAELGVSVFTIEIVEPLGERARRTLQELGYAVHLRIGDGYGGWPEEAPFDAIVLTAAPPRIPEPLVAQLKVGGRMVLPVGRESQELMVLTKQPDGGFTSERILPVRFVPMTGQAQLSPPR